MQTMRLLNLRVMTMADTPNDLELHKATKAQQDLIQMKGTIETMREMEPTITEYNAILAKIHRAKFVAYIDAGFDADQALEFVLNTEMITT